MSDDDANIAVLKERVDRHKERIEALESNQKWGVLTILGLAAKALFDFVSKGQP